MATTSLQNINWLSASKKVWLVYIKEKSVPVSIPFPKNVFLYFLEGQVHKDSKLGILTNVGKSRLVKVIFSNIHKISDACASSFYRLPWSWLHKVWKMFLLFIEFKFLWCFWENHLPRHLQALQQLFSPHLFNFIQKTSRPTSI